MFMNENKCLDCSHNVKNCDNNIFLPCGCSFAFCNDKCFNQYLNQVISCLTIICQDVSQFCKKCKHKFTKNDLFEILLIILNNYKIFENEKCKKNKEIFHNEIKTILTNIFDSNCMYCKCDVNESNSITITVKPKKQKELYDIMGSKIMTHRVCNKCLNNKTNKCSICCSYHYKVAN
jgi:hypothetical protein